MNDYGEVLINTPMTRGTFTEIMYRFVRAQENSWTPYQVDEKWIPYESSVLPFKVKHPKDWEIVELNSKDLNEVIIWKSDSIFYQSMPQSVYPNTAKFLVSIDKNPKALSREEYFSNLKMLFPNSSFSNGTLSTFSTLKVNDDLYVYLDSGSRSGKILVVYTENGSGILSEQNRKFLNLMLQDLEYKELPPETSANIDYSSLKNDINKNILIEGQGNNILNQLPSKTIIETDAIGVGTGPIDYYFCSEINMTLKYERAGDVILDARDGQTSSF